MHSLLCVFFLSKKISQRKECDVKMVFNKRTSFSNIIFKTNLNLNFKHSANAQELVSQIYVFSRENL